MSATDIPLAAPSFRAKLERCIHCGLCLPSCPTYEVFRTEMDAPRGRIALIGAAAAGRIGTDGAFREHIDLCLGCRSCETACPSGVEYGALLETARQAIEAHRAHSRVERLARWLGLRQLLPHRRRLRAAARLLGLAQRLGMTRLLPVKTRRAARLLPPLRDGYPDMRRPAPAVGKQRGTVAFFQGCVQDAFLPQVHAATIRVLQRNGYQVRFPPGQTCCGAAARHLGETALARELVRRNLAAFAGVDLIVNNAGGCGAQLKDCAPLFPDPDEAAAATRFAARVRDASELFAGALPVAPEHPIRARVTYVDPCHLRHVQRVVDPPRRLLRQIPGLELVELAHPDLCCGSAGVYNLTQPDAADRVLALKLDEIRATGAEIVVTANPGCQLQLRRGVETAGLDVEVLHVFELVDRAYGSPSTDRAV